MTTAFWCVAAAFVLIYLTRLPVSFAQLKTGKFDNNHPRDQQAKLEGWGRRAVAAHMNGFEGFAGFAASVFVAHLAHGNEHTAGLLAITYVVARVIYVALYIGNVATLRSAVWTVGLVATFGLFVLPVLG
ncbi:MAG TPA: MAPEG family protein [Polyangiaceae bacterium]